MKFLVILNLIALSQALAFNKNFLHKDLVLQQTLETEPISPYAFSYTSDATDGSSTRQESADAQGVVRGSYTIVSADGIKRIVNYIADENGFRAQVQTNEPGTESKSSADVLMQSSQLPAQEIALKYGPRPDEQKPQLVEALALKGVQKKVQFIQPLIGLKQKSLGDFSAPQIDTPIKLLTKIPKIHTLKPFGLDLQTKEEQSFEGF